MIYCILGVSGAGKTTIAQEVAKRLNIELVVSYTSRPKRAGEQDGVDYHYVDNNYFDEHKDEFMEIREYTVYDGSVWKYGYKQDSFNFKDKSKIVILETYGYPAFEEYFGKERLKPIIINAFSEDLYARAQKRGDDPQEIKRRISEDILKIAEFKNNTDNCANVYNHFELEFAIMQAMKIIMRGEK